MLKPVKVGLMGLGTVGGGTATVLGRNAVEIERRAATQTKKAEKKAEAEPAEKVEEKAETKPEEQAEEKVKEAPDQPES